LHVETLSAMLGGLDYENRHTVWLQCIHHRHEMHCYERLGPVVRHCAVQ